jgi:transposase
VIDYVDSTAAKIILAANDGDSIRRIAQKIDGTYSWVYTWIERLEEVGVVERADGIRVTAPEVRERYAQLMEVISQQIPTTVDEAYVIPHFAGMDFAYAKIDAVYVWTHGGYQIARGGDAYPVFMRINEADVDQWQSFFNRYNIPSVVGERDDTVVNDTASSIYYSVYPASESLTCEWVKGNPVIPLSETVEYIQEYPWNFEPALEMIVNEYDIEIDDIGYAPAQ